METLNQPSDNTFTPASDGSRIVAFIIDALISGALSIIPVAGWIAGVAYMLTRDALPFLDGQSVGKKAMNLRAVTEDGAPLTNNWGATVVRNIVLMIPLFVIVELIVMLNNANKQRLGDQWAKTKVIESRK